MTNKYYLVGAVVVIAVVVLFFSRVSSPKGNTVVVNEQSITEKVVSIITSRLPSFGGNVTQGVTNFTEIAAGSLAEGTADCTSDPAISSASSTCVITNRTGTDWFIDKAVIYPTTSASGTIIAFVATTTGATSTIANYLYPTLVSTPALGTGNIGIGAFVISPTVIATGTPSHQPVQNNVFSSRDGLAASTTATSTFVVKNGESVLLGVRGSAPTCGGAEGSVANSRLAQTCPSATSTNRTPVRLWIKYFRFY